MSHPHSAWDRAALERYIGTTEGLTIEFKSHRALLADGKRTRSDRVLEAARDVAGMANEQGGTIIYGIEESGETGFRVATAVGEGFSASDKVDREWFVQVMRDHINPPLTELDVAQVDLDGGSHVALAVDVPQSRGVARQTDDLFFPRRDAQGLHNMTVQEIEDVRARTERPELELRVSGPMGSRLDGMLYQVRANFEVVNVSKVTATFAVITIGVRPPTKLDVDAYSRELPPSGDWTLARTVLASGSSDAWSPLTPGFSLPSPAYVSFQLTRLMPPEDDWRPFGVARLDHDGGARLYWLEVGPHVGMQLRLEPFPSDLVWEAWQPPEMFRPLT